MEPAEEILTCPFDKSHRILRHRMAYHITICSKNHQKDNMKRCPYDASHVVNANEYEEHLLHCETRDSVMQPESNDDGTQDGASNILPIDANKNDTWGEGAWESETKFRTYKPLENIQTRPIVYPKIGLSKAQRKQHRIQEKRRFNEVMKSNTPKDN